MHVTADKDEQSEIFCSEDFAEPVMDAWPCDMPDTNTNIPNDARMNMQSQLTSWLMQAFNAKQK